MSNEFPDSDVVRGPVLGTDTFLEAAFKDLLEQERFSVVEKFHDADLVIEDSAGQYVAIDLKSAHSAAISRPPQSSSSWSSRRSERRLKNLLLRAVPHPSRPD